MEIQDFIRDWYQIQSPVVTVLEVTGSEPNIQYSVQITGTVGTTPVNYFYTTTSNENQSDLADSSSRVTRYAQLTLQAETQVILTTLVQEQIDILNPPPPDPEP